MPKSRLTSITTPTLHFRFDDADGTVRGVFWVCREPLKRLFRFPLKGEHKARLIFSTLYQPRARKIYLRWTTSATWGDRCITWGYTPHATGSLYWGLNFFLFRRRRILGLVRGQTAQVYVRVQQVHIKRIKRPPR